MTKIDELKQYLGNCIEAGTVGTLAAARIEAEINALKADLKLAQDQNCEYAAREDRKGFEISAHLDHINNQDAELSQWRQSGTKMMDEILRLSADYVRLAEITDLMNNIGFTMQIDRRGCKYIHHDDHGDFYYSRETREDGAK